MTRTFARRRPLAAIARLSIVLGLLALGPVLAVAPAGPAVAAGNAAGTSLGKSGLPVPRFVSLKTKRVNVRIGPGQDYRVAWVFTRPGLPVEVIQEYDNWRRIRAADGSVGWVFHSLLSGQRTVTVTPWGSDDPTPVFRRPRDGAAVAAYLKAGVQGEVDECVDEWCRITGAGYRGWIRQDRLWGVYPDETFD